MSRLRHLTAARFIAIIGAPVFIFGFVTWLNGPLITFAQLAFDLDEVHAFRPDRVLPVDFFLAIPSSGSSAHRHEEGAGAGPVRDGGGAALFASSATRWYPGALGGLFVIGGGLALLQTRQSLHQHPRPDRKRRAAIA